MPLHNQKQMAYLRQMANQENPTPQDTTTEPLGQSPGLGDPAKTEGSETLQQSHGTRRFPNDGTESDQHTQINTGSKSKKVGRYPVKQLLGRGGFGEVYLGFDDQLKRDVAIKLTYGSKVGPEAAKMFMEEARILAELDHPNIVPVFDVGATEMGDVFIVSKFIDGTDLATRIERDRPSRELSIEIIIKIAEALHYAHTKGLIHRDVKPANILLDKSSRPYLADFGIALRESEQVGLGEITGTPAYMSPEQARGEGHLISHQSDIFSLGLVLYELLSGRRTYQGNTTKALIRLAQVAEVRTPRLFDSTISREIERICLKALARRPSDRYAIAKDFAEDLQFSISNNGKTETLKQSNSPPNANQPKKQAESTDQNKPPTHSEGSKPTLIDSEKRLEAAKIVPRGLRSFDQNDSDFFLELLPGPRDRSGLPESLKFWKDRIETTQIEESFRVGLIYGPSGCGKSSLMKAGLLPRLSPKIERIYIEATPEDTLARLYKEIQKKVPEAASCNLVETLNLVRRRKLVPNGGKLLLVIDQFEQWLHAHHEYTNQELADVLRQCDGETVQTILMVRDDFWLSASRFFGDLDVPILERENAALVDLFDLDHAKHVLELFGQAYERLPKDRSSRTEQQKQFLQTAVEGLAENRKVISVRLALFAEMMKSREWVPKSIGEVGGVSGVGVRFLEETFGDKFATIQIRKHQQAVRGILSGLLPSTGTDIKGHNRNSTELQKAVGYEMRPVEFAELIRLLDKNLRLITPSDESGNENRCYQLTHDYLVPSLREWLNQKQRETKKGRAELKLAERAAIWWVNQENKQLPTLWEWIQIRRFTAPTKWNVNEKAAMRTADRYHTTRALLATTFAIALILSGLGIKHWNDQRLIDRDAASLVSKIEAADFGKLADEFKNVPAMRAAVVSKLKEALGKTKPDSDEALKLSLALLPSDPTQLEYLVGRLQSAQASQVKLIVDQLRPHKEKIRELLWSAIEGENKAAWLPVACALADYDPSNKEWKRISANITDSLVKENALHLGTWIEMLRPAATHLKPPLAEIYKATADSNKSKAQIDLATEILETYAATDFSVLHELILTGTPEQFARMFRKYEAFRKEALARLREDVARTFVPDRTASAQEVEQSRLQWIARQANAAVALMRLEDPQPVYQFLTVDRDPEALSQFIHRIRGREVSPSLLIKSLYELAKLPTPEAANERQQHYLRLYGMILGLGEFPLDQLQATERDGLIKQLSGMYRQHPSRAVHSALGWLLRRWGEDERVRLIDETPLAYDATGVREWYVIKVNPPEVTRSVGSVVITSSVAPIYFTMIVFPGGEFQMGEIGETRTVSVPGPIAVSDREVTWRQFSPIDKDLYRRRWEDQFSKDLGGRRLLPNEPAFGVSWLDAVNYCRWLTEAWMPGEENQSYVKKRLTPEQTSEPGWLNLQDPRDWDWPMDPNKPGFRLLTDREWEYVARGGTETPYSFGTSESLLMEYGWYGGNSGGWSHPTAMLRPSVAGLLDIHGNLWEWVDDWYGNRSDRVVRGGSWLLGATLCRSADRGRFGTSFRSNIFLGFRVALSPSGIPQSQEADK